MNRSSHKSYNRTLGGFVLLFVSMIVLLTACSNSASPGPTTSGTSAAPAPSMTTAATSVQGTTTAAKATTKAVRALDGPQAKSTQLIVKTGETQAVTGKKSGSELVFIWVEVENLTDMPFTVSSLFSVTMTDKVTGSLSSSPNVPDTLIRLASIDPVALTLDGKLTARGRIAGWVYAEFPAGVSQVAVKMILTGSDGTKTEPLTVEITMRKG